MVDNNINENVIVMGLFSIISLVFMLIFHQPVFGFLMLATTGATVILFIHSVYLEIDGVDIYE